jgi:hypothetical protein
MTTDTLVLCAMVYDWYLIGCNNTIIAPIIAAQCKDPVIIQQVNNYKTQIDIRIQQIIKIEIQPSRDGGGGNGKLRDLTISITIAKHPITRGSVQTIIVTVSDAKSHEKIEGAIVKLSVKYASGKHTEEFGSKITDSSGKVSFSWRIGGNAIPGTFTGTVQVSTPGSKSVSKTTSFQVAPKDNTTLPIVNDTIINETSRVMPNDTDTIGNETGFSDGEQGGDTGNDNGDNTTILQTLPDPCLENPSLPECTQPTKSTSPNEKLETLSEQKPTPPNLEDGGGEDGNDGGNIDSGSSGDKGSNNQNTAGGGNEEDNEEDSSGDDDVPE